MAGPGKQLDEEEWYHGVLPRDEVQRLLVTDGDYLVRMSHNRKTGESQFVLSVFWNGHKHFIIQGSDGQWRFEGDSYPTVQELILNQHKSGVPVTKRSEAILKKPIVREAWELSNDAVELGMKIGNGNFGEVFRGNLTKDGKVLDVAVKTCREKLSDDQKKKFLQEGRILKQYDHPNIVKLIGIAATKHPVMIVMEYVAGGALVNFLRRHGASKTKKDLARMCMDTAAGMAYLESKNCIHRDLAARNCLVGENNVVKISDFGMSREEEEYTVSGGLKQIPIKWTAPEALHYARYTSACDVWSFGILMWEVFSNGKTPYPGLTNNQARDKIDEGYRMPPPDNTPPTVSALMSRCWEQEPNDRPKFDEILKELENIQASL